MNVSEATGRQPVHRPGGGLARPFLLPHQQTSPRQQVHRQEEHELDQPLVHENRETDVGRETVDRLPDIALQHRAAEGSLPRVPRPGETTASSPGTTNGNDQAQISATRLSRPRCAPGQGTHRPQLLE